MRKSFIITFSIIFFSLIFSLFAYSAPLSNVPVTLTQPDGTVIECFASGDEYFNYCHDADGRLIKEGDDGWYRYCSVKGDEIVADGLKVGAADENGSGAEMSDFSGVSVSDISDIAEKKTIESRKMREIPNDEAAPSLSEAGQLFTAGESTQINNIIITIFFSDENSTDALSLYRTRQAKLNAAYNTGYSEFDNPVVSVKDYFNKVSSGCMDIMSSFFPKSADGSQYLYYVDSHPRAYYQPKSATNTIGYSGNESTTREFQLLKDATANVSSQIIASRLNIDVDNNGYADSVSFVVSGTADGWSDLLWPHQWSLYLDGYETYIGSIRVYTFSLNFIEWMLSNISGTEMPFIGTPCHEMLHTFGFPDMYDYQNQSNTAIGICEVMAGTLSVPQYPTVYTRQRWGGTEWPGGAEIETLTTDAKQTLTLECSTSQDGTIAFILPSSLTGYKSQYSTGVTHNRDIYIEYRGEDGPYSAADLIYYSNAAKTSRVTYGSTGCFGFCDNGLLVYETDLNIDDNTRNYFNIASNMKDNYTLYAYRLFNTIYTDPIAFGSDSATIGLSDGRVLYISNITQNADKSSVTFDVEIRDYQLPQLDLGDDGVAYIAESNAEIYVPAGMTAAEVISAVTAPAVSGVIMNAAQTMNTPTVKLYNGNNVEVSGDTIVKRDFYLVITIGNKTFNAVFISIKGDIDGDGIVSFSEFASIMAYITGSSAGTGEKFVFLSDANGDGVLNALDLILIMPSLPRSET